MKDEARKEVKAMATLATMTLKTLVAALRELQLQPTHLGERTRDEIIRHIGRELTPSAVLSEVWRQQEEA